MSKRLMHKGGSLALLGLAACANVQAAPAPDACSPAALAGFTGQPATSDVGARMLAATGKRLIRWVRPGTMVTMEYSEDRLTVHLDATNKVERASCG